MWERWYLLETYVVEFRVVEVIEMRRKEFDDKIRNMAKVSDDDFKIEELEKRVGDLEDIVRDLKKNLAEVMLVMLRMNPVYPYADRSGMVIPDTGYAVRPWDITYKG